MPRRLAAPLLLDSYPSGFKTADAIFVPRPLSVLLPPHWLFRPPPLPTTSKPQPDQPTTSRLKTLLRLSQPVLVRRHTLAPPPRQVPRRSLASPVISRSKNRCH